MQAWSRIKGYIGRYIVLKGQDQFHLYFYSLIHWEDLFTSGTLFGIVLLVLVMTYHTSFILTITYISLPLLFTVVLFKLYRFLMLKMDRPEPGNIHLSWAADMMNMMDIFKIAMLVLFLAYISLWFSTVTLLIFVWTAAFTVPKIYEHQRTKKVIEMIKNGPKSSIIQQSAKKIRVKFRKRDTETKQNG